MHARKGGYVKRVFNNTRLAFEERNVQLRFGMFRISKIDNRVMVRIDPQMSWR